MREWTLAIADFLGARMFKGKGTDERWRTFLASVDESEVIQSFGRWLCGWEVWIHLILHTGYGTCC